MSNNLASKKLAQYRCPLCQQALLLDEKSYRCENNHSFDQAKQGYVNLLPVQFKHSKEPGDNKAVCYGNGEVSLADLAQKWTSRITRYWVAGCKPLNA